MRPLKTPLLNEMNEFKCSKGSESTLINRTVMFSIIILLCSVPLLSAQSNDNQMGPDISSMFSLNRLSEYNQLIDCISKIRPEFTRCNIDAQRKGEKVLKYVDESWELGIILKCCGVWLVRDCWVEAAASKNCSPAQVDQLRNMPSKFMPGLKDVCHKYPPGSSACNTPYIIAGAMLFSFLVLLVLFVVIATIIYRSIRRRRHRHTNMSDIHDKEPKRRIKEKVKLTSKSSDNDNNNNNNNEIIQFIDSAKNNKHPSDSKKSIP